MKNLKLFAKLLFIAILACIAAIILIPLVARI